MSKPSIVVMMTADELRAEMQKVIDRHNAKYHVESWEQLMAAGGTDLDWSDPRRGLVDDLHGYAWLLGLEGS